MTDSSSQRVLTRSAELGSRAVVYGFTLLYAAIFVAAAATNYLLYLAPHLDLGNMVQVVWSTAHGHFLQEGFPANPSFSRLAIHFDPFLALLVPLWWMWSNPLVLLGAQAVAVASGALPVYWLARKHIGQGGLATLFPIAYLLYSPTQFNAFTPIGIHAVSFAIPLILYAVWFLDEDRLFWFGVFAAVAATTKEEIAAAVGGLGIWYAIRRGRRYVGATIFVVGILTSVLIVEVVIPHYSPSGSLPYSGRYADVGGTPTGMVHMAVTDPHAFINQLATWHKLLFLVLIFLPFVGVWALEPIMLVGALPDLGINLMSSKPEQTTVFYQYTAGIVPFVVAASILGTAKLTPRRYAGPALVAAIGCLGLVSPLVYSVSSIHSRSAQQVEATRHALELIPAGVPVSASQTVGAYVSARRRVGIFPDVTGVNWVVVGPIASAVEDPLTFRRTLARLESNDHWRVRFNAAGIEVFERGT